MAAIGFQPIKEEGFILSLSPENEKALGEYIEFIEEMESQGEHYLGPHFIHHHEDFGHTLHFLEDCNEGHFILYQAECRIEADRKRTEGDKKRNDLFGITEHISGNDDWSVSLDPSCFSNFARFAGGTSPNRLADANAIAYTVASRGYYHILIVVVKNVKKGDAMQYYYRGLADEMKYKKIPSVEIPCSTK